MYANMVTGTKLLRQILQKRVEGYIPYQFLINIKDNTIWYYAQGGGLNRIRAKNQQVYQGILEYERRTGKSIEDRL